LLSKKLKIKVYRTIILPIVLYGFPHLRERDHWGDPDVDRRIILRWIFRKWGAWGLDGVGSVSKICMTTYCCV
jgi:hypothetical protein